MAVKHNFPMQSGPREDLFEILRNYTDDKSTSAILHIILQGVNIRDHNFKIIEAVSKYSLESNRFAYISPMLANCNMLINTLKQYYVGLCHNKLLFLAFILSATKPTL